MSEKQFEGFLVKALIDWAKESVSPGFRYQFRTPSDDNRLKLYEAMTRESNDEVSFMGSNHKVINLGTLRLLPLLHLDDDRGLNEHYIATLRDYVAPDLNGPLAGCVVIIIHNSDLDTIHNSSDRLDKHNGIWSPLRIKEMLGNLINEKDTGKDISRCLLDYQFAAIQEDGATMFGFAPLYKALLDGDLKFDELSLLNDPLIESFSGKPQQIKKRLEENRKLYKELEYVVEHFPNQLENRLLDFGSKFIQKSFPADNIDNWKQIDFQVFRDEANKNKKKTLEFENEIAGNGLKLFARDRGETKAGKRERNIIIVVDDNQAEIEFELHFIGSDLVDKQLKKASKCPFSQADFKVLSKGTKRTKTICRAPFDGNPFFFTLSTDRDKPSERFKFNCLAVQKSDFYIEAFKTNFAIAPNKKEVVLQTDNCKLKINSELSNCYLIENINQEVDAACYGEIDYSKLVDESDLVEFIVKRGAHSLKFSIEGQTATDSLTLPILFDSDRYIRLLKDEYYGEFNRSKNVVIIDNKEVTPVSIRLNLLRWEARFLDEEMIAFPEAGGVKLSALEQVDPALYQAYRNLFSYLQSIETLPSLVGWGPDFRQHSKAIIESYISYLAKIPKNTALNSDQKLAMNLGIGVFDGKEYLTPYNPLILAYFLSIAEHIALDAEDRSFETLPKVTLERLTPRGLLPYVYNNKCGFSYSQQVKENVFWLELVPQQESSYQFVRKLVNEKIREFKRAFNQLFAANNDSKLIINALNQQSSEELFLGLVDYFKEELDEACQVHVNLYDDSLQFNAFDRFAEESSLTEIKTKLELDRGASKDNADTIIDLLRIKLTYSKFTHIQVNNKQAYAHLAFFRNNQKIDCRQVDIDSALSGVAADGFLANEASENKSGSYYTSFGLKKVDYEDIPHLRLAKLYGSLMRPARESNAQFTGSNAVTLAVSDDFKNLLEQAYDAAIWTTIIDPKVTLEFFTSNQDVVLIHYSDQYSSSASYDAITVTRETELFRRVLQQGQGGSIDEFNAFNGEWLLKMLTASANERKGIEGIIGAYKFITGLIIDSDITWVPLSVAEMIRVSGNIGLKMSDSEFSRNVQGYRSGAISDDVLLVGFKAQELYLLPVEVKTGARPDYVKAVKQAKELKRYLVTLLGPRAFANKLYRALFIRQILTQIDKYCLYKVFSEDYFEPSLNDREKWLCGNYQLADVENYPQGFVVAHVDSDTVFEPTYIETESILKIELPYSLLTGLVKTPLHALLDKRGIQKHCHVPNEYILSGETKSTPVNIVVDFMQEDDEVHQDPAMTSLQDLTPVEINPKGSDGHNAVEVLPQIDNSQTLPPSEPLKILFGHKVMTQEPIFWEPTNTNKVFNTNTGIIGTMGTGKTQFTKSLITQMIRSQKNNVGGKGIGVLIFDYKADYVKDDFIQATNAKVYNLFNLPFNPFALLGNKPILPVHTASQFRATLSRSFGLGPKQENRIHGLVMEAYEKAGISPTDASTWTKSAPTLKNIWDLYNEQDKVEQDSLYAALYELNTFQIFEPMPEKTQSLYDVLNGVVVINLSGYDTKIQNLVVAITLDIFYSQMHQHGSSHLDGNYRQITKMILVDEADNFMSQEFESLKKILKEGREFGVGTILSTQELTHFKTSEADYSSYILTWIIHRVSQLKNQEIKAIFNPKDKQTEEDIMQQIRTLDKHYSLYIDGEKKIAKLKDMAFWQLLIND
ncbi:DNA phosphorothioation-dependent restriction protein DptH [Geobacter sp. SVR]|uniref:DNA phosphorothioation-dependent restriction protein DptH n=1 Tax=Geobacter sp. SVR TaxID=2495594 RepID=UPI00143EF9F9|nr:DNA phosphorothioation-dependent restriction protein DptH [Geobacter sp. SVR]BCS52638.1 hypothetical protein GSVR_09460 [Geobacter sp. SVR]GCF83925.1 hypothetical protein GSbR_05250 [Geobacter sp. SVR]